MFADADIAARPPPRGGGGHRSVLVLGVALLFWSAIEVWSLLLNRLNGISPTADLAAGRIAGIFSAAVISAAAYAVLRRAPDRPGRRFALGAACAVASSAAYAAGMVILAEWLPVPHPAGARGLAQFAWETLFFLIPFSLWTVITLVFQAGRRDRDRDKRLSDALVAAREAELRALHYQVNPHFLYNALNSLSTLILDRRIEQADDMVQRLAAFFRGRLTVDPLRDVTLAEEIETQKLYLDLEQLRFSGRMRIDIDVPADLQAAAVPSLILQPLVENAVKHGVHPPGRCTVIALTASRTPQGLRIEVCDNGPKHPGPGSAGIGVGLENVRSRLRARYGDQATLTAGRETEAAFVARIELPFDPPAGPDPVPRLPE